MSINSLEETQRAVQAIRDSLYAAGDITVVVLRHHISKTRTARVSSDRIVFRGIPIKHLAAFRRSGFSYQTRVVYRGPRLRTVPYPVESFTRKENATHFDVYHVLNKKEKGK